MNARIRIPAPDSRSVTDRALDRIAHLLHRETWFVAGETGADRQYVEYLEAEAPRGWNTWDIRALATRGTLELSLENNALRLRYRPSTVGMLAAAALIAYLSGWVIREIVEFGIPTREASQWFDSNWRVALQLLIGVLFAYPLLRWRFTRMCRKALRLTDAEWARYASVSHMWRRASACAILIVGPLALALVRWLAWCSAATHDFALHGFGGVALRPLAWPTLQVALLTGALLFIDWDALVFEAPGRFFERWSPWRGRND